MENACCNGIRYDSEIDAMKHITDIEKTYPCVVCDGWHIISDGVYVVIAINIISGVFMPCGVFTTYDDANKYALYVNSLRKNMMYCIVSGAVKMNPGGK